MSASVGIVASFSRAVLASPECARHHQNTAFTHSQPPVVAQDGPQLRVHPSLYHVVGRRQTTRSPLQHMSTTRSRATQIPST